MALTAKSRVEGHILHKEAGVKKQMGEYTKINFNHRKDISDYSDLVETLFPGNCNQQHAAACILFELKWARDLLSNLGYMEKHYNISRRVLQRTRAKLSKLGLIEYISRFNMRYGGQAGWKISTRFERSLNRLARRCASFRDTKSISKEKASMLIEFMNAKRSISGSYNRNVPSPKAAGGESSCLEKV